MRSIFRFDKKNNNTKYKIQKTRINKYKYKIQNTKCQNYNNIWPNSTRIQ